MNNKFESWARRVYAENREVVEHWSSSPDIVEQALARGIREVVEGSK